LLGEKGIPRVVYMGEGFHVGETPQGYFQMTVTSCVKLIAEVFSTVGLNFSYVYLSKEVLGAELIQAVVEVDISEL